MLEFNYKGNVKKGKDRPTKTMCKLKNGTIIRCLPTGLTGSGIRGIPADRLYPDECHYIPEDVWTAVTPMLLTTGGVIRASTTPRGKIGYVYEKMYKNPKFKVFHVSSEDVMKNRPISETWTQKQRDGALEHLEDEKKTMSKLNYAQEYLGEFLDDLMRLFSNEIIKKCCILKRRARMVPGRYYMGSDIARMGDDEITHEILDRMSEDKIHHVENIFTKRKLMTETYDKIIELQREWKLRQIGIDAGSGGLGVSLLDFLLRNSATRDRVVPLTNQKRELDSEGKKKATLLKEDMYINMLAMMEHGILKLLDDDEIAESLASIQYEHVIEPGKPTKTRIYGRYTHIAEGLIRAAWLAQKDKSLKLWASYSGDREYGIFR